MRRTIRRVLRRAPMVGRARRARLGGTKKEVLTRSVITKFSGPPFSHSPMSNCTYGTRSLTNTAGRRPIELGIVRRVSTKRCSRERVRRKRTIHVVANTTVPGNYGYYVCRRSASCNRSAMRICDRRGQ